MLIKKETRTYFGKDEDVTIISITDSVYDGLIYNKIIEHENYSELMELAEKISQLNNLWYEAEQGDRDAWTEHNIFEKIVAAEYEKLMGNWDTAGTYEESFWEVVNLAIGNTD